MGWIYYNYSAEPTVVTEQADGLNAWETPEGLIFEDSNEARQLFVNTTAENSNRLLLTGFGFSLPAGFELFGMKVEFGGQGMSTVETVSLSQLYFHDSTGQNSSNCAPGAIVALDNETVYGQLSTGFFYPSGTIRRWTKSALENAAFGVMLKFSCSPVTTLTYAVNSVTLRLLGGVLDSSNAGGVLVAGSGGKRGSLFRIPGRKIGPLVGVPVGYDP